MVEPANLQGSKSGIVMGYTTFSSNHVPLERAESVKIVAVGHWY